MAENTILICVKYQSKECKCALPPDRQVTGPYNGASWGRSGVLLY